MKKDKGSVSNKKIYLVLNPAMEESMLLERLNTIVTQDIFAIQIWDNFRQGQRIEKLIRKIHAVCTPHHIPLLINNRWEYLITTELDGVHFDHIPEDINAIKNKIGRKFIIGITCGNDLKPVEWASEHDIDYISFCSMFPSVSAQACEIVNRQTVQKARQIFENPIFLAGGIYPENLITLQGLDFDGIAVISGIMNAEYPDKTIDKYKHHLKKVK